MTQAEFNHYFSQGQQAAARGLDKDCLPATALRNSSVKAVWLQGHRHGSLAK